jgi:hypothetical protein
MLFGTSYSYSSYCFRLHTFTVRINSLSPSLLFDVHKYNVPGGRSGHVPVQGHVTFLYPFLNTNIHGNSMELNNTHTYTIDYFRNCNRC